MKVCLKILMFLLLSFIAVLQILAQSTTTSNYVQTTAIKQAGIMHEASLSTLNITYNGKAQSVSYIDGLGRVSQTVVVKGSATQKDLVSPVEYDVFGRQVKMYLPYADLASTTYGSLKPDWLTKQAAFYNGLLSGVETDAMPYAQTVLEKSPLRRPLAQGSPGIIWQPNMTDAYDVSKKTVRIKYEVNMATDNVVVWNVANPGTNFDITQITRNGYYSDGLLNVQRTWDEHSNEIREYTDKEGHVLLKRMQDGASTWAETYYIYDDFGRLRAVIQPEGVAALPATLDNTFANKWMFLYRYDERGRMVMKDVPGADSVVMIYDQWDRMVLTQDGVQRGKANKEFLFTKYDYLNRPIMTGVYVNNSAHNTIRDLVTASTIRFENISTAAAEGYTLNLSFPTAYQELLTIMHYDDYNNLPSWKSGYAFTAENGNTAYNSLVIGKVVGSQTKILGTATWLRTVTYYDEEYRAIQVYGDNIKGGKDRMTNQLLWDGKPIEQWQSHTSTFYSSSPIVIKKKFTYDHADRIVTVKHQIDNQEEVNLTTNIYNELGQLLNKKLHTSASHPTELQKLDYGYNIRGWLVNMNRVENTAGITTYETGDLFAFELGYNVTMLSGSTPQYNSNISEQRWKGPLAETPNGYSYAYDRLNRLLSSVSSEKAASWTVNNKYDEKGITYDKNGNIKSLQRYDNGNAIDNLTYTYSGNQLTKVEDVGDVTLGFKNGANTTIEYFYNQNGSMNKDDNKSISNIIYNHLNLPEAVTVNTKGNVSYLYDATGNKLRKISFDQATAKSDTMWYTGSIIYAKDTLQFINLEEGRVRPIKINPNAAASANNFIYVYDYFLRDHLGNVRVVATTQSKIIQYTATMEPGNATVEDQLFSNVSATAVTKPAGFDGLGANTKVSKLNGDINTAGNKRVGPTIILKVMAGDTISVSSQAWYSGSVQAPPGGVAPIASELINLLTSGIVSLGGGKGGVFNSTYINGLSTTAVNNFITNNQVYNTSQPKAFLNWMILDEQFVLTDNSSYRGAVQVPVIAAGVTKQQLVGPVNLVVQKSGYLYVYVSNESNMNVYFDDVVINHKSGPVLETTNYRAFGTEIATLSTKAFANAENKYHFGNKEKQSGEFSDGSGLDWSDFGAREFDPMLARWMVADPLCDKSRRWSPYNYAYNNPIRFIDPDGMFSSPFQKNDAQQYEEQTTAAMQVSKAISNALNGAGNTHIELNSDGTIKSQQTFSVPLAGQHYFESPEAAAIEWGKRYNGKSIKEKREYYSFIYSINFKVNGKVLKYYAYTEPATGGSKTVPFSTIDQLHKTLPSGATAEYDIHSHGASDYRYRDEEFSPDNGDKNGNPDGDMAVNRHYNIGGFLASPSGLLQVMRTDVGNASTICDCLESDKQANRRPTGKIYYENFRDPNNPYKQVSTDISPISFSKEQIERIKNQ